MKRFINIQNNIHRVIYYLSITILMCGGIIGLFPSIDAIAETEQACQREIRGISRKLGAKPSPEAYSKALRYCMAGDMRRATSVLQTDSRSGAKKQMSKNDCKYELLRLSHRLRVMPGKKSYNKALRSCQQGDMRGAYSVLKADSGSGSNKKVSKAWCKEELRVFGMRLGVKTSNKSFSKALRYCQQRDLENAHNVITAAR